jgi:uncharacterized protein (TIGR00290 family)
MIGRVEPTLALAWSGGKDSALALWALRAQGRAPQRLLSTVTEETGRVAMHAVRGELLQAQADAAGLPLVRIEVPWPCPDAVYESRMAAVFDGGDLDGVGEVAFGDLFLRDIREYREQRLATAGVRASFPVWGLDTAELARRFVGLGFRAVLVCVDTRALPASFAGREFDERLLAELPAGVDPCGENGEFHTFVYDGPVFERAVAWSRGESCEREGFAFCDLLAGGPGVADLRGLAAGAGS